MDKQTWINRCSAQFQKRGEMLEEDALAAAEACLENLENDLSENPEDAADDYINYGYEN